MHQNENPYFLPYQIDWLNDHSKRKLWEKSRRIGATYVQSYEDVRDCVKNPDLPVWFSSADESASKEYIIYCTQWAKIFKVMGEILSIKEEFLDEKKGIQALVIRFKNGSRIHGLSSNPKMFRSKGGKTILDEFDWHQNQELMYAAAKPCVTWGYDMRILSTYQSNTSLYAQFVKDTKKALTNDKKPVFSLHTVNIYDAIEQGLLDRILKKETTKEERDAWIKEEKSACGDESIWLQEYCCIPVDETTAFLSWDMIKPCESEDAGKPGLSGGGHFYIGNDIGRRKDLAVFWVIEKVGDIFWTREVVKLKNASFAAQDDELSRLYSIYHPVRICMDQTGMGEKPVEDAISKYGAYKVEGVLFTNTVKQEIAFAVRRHFENIQVRIPADKDIRRAHHAIKKTTTAAGNIRFDAARTSKGHADEFWAHALALHAASEPIANIEFESTGNRRNTTRMNNY